MAVFGISTLVLTVVTFALFGVAVRRAGAYTTLIGGLPMAAIVPLPVVVFGRIAFPVRSLWAMSESALVLVFATLGYVLMAESDPANPGVPASESVAQHRSTLGLEPQHGEQRNLTRLNLVSPRTSACFRAVTSDIPGDSRGGR